MTQRARKKALNTSMLTLGGLRELIRQTLTSDSEFGAFCLDNFPDVYRHYSAGMDRVAKETLLLESVSHDTTHLQALLVSYLSKTKPSSIVKCPIVATSKILDVDYRVSFDQFGVRTMVPASGHVVRLTVEAVDSRTTIIQNLVPVIHSRSEAIGRLTRHWGIVEPRPFEVLLDESPPCLRPINPKGPNFPFKISSQDPEIFDLTVRTALGDVKWWLELSWTSLGQEGVLRIDLGGSPFRTMSLR